MGKKITRTQVEEVSELVNQWVVENLEPSSGVVVITAEKCKDGTAKVATSYTIEGLSSVVWVGTEAIGEKSTTGLYVRGMEHPVTLETKPEPVNLSDMWEFFTRNDYLSTKNLKAIRRAEASEFEVKLSPVLLWRGREGKKVLEVRIPACGVRQALELVFLVHVWNFLYDIGVPRVLGSCPIRTHDSNRPAITGLAQGNTTVISNDMRTAGALYSEIVHLLCANDVRTSDWRINQELGLKPWEG